MKTETISRTTDSKLRSVKKIKQAILSFYDKEDKKERKPNRDGQASSHTSSVYSPGSILFTDENTQIGERIGHLFEWREVFPPHEYFLDMPYHEKAKKLDGSESQFNKITADSRKDSNELNVSLVLGQMFNTVYPNSVFSAPYYQTGISANFGDVIKFEEPLDRNIFVRSYTYAFLPDATEKWFYLDRGNQDVAEMGIEAYLHTHLSCDIDQNDRPDLMSFRFHKFLDIYDSDQTRTAYYESPAFFVENVLRIPAGVTEFNYSAGIRSRVYSSKDFSQLSALQNDQYGFAMLDLRNTLKPSQTPILRDPLGAWDKQPFGGIRLYIVLEFHEVESVLTV